MPAIFYDLETTSLNPIGQILNYAFIHVDDDLQILSVCKGDVRFSKNQIPEPNALLANKIDPLSQMNAPESEFDAANKIHRFIENITETSRTPVVLIGQNSSKFDLHFLRNVFVRHGLFPYFGRNLVYSDIIFATRYVLFHNKNLQSKFKNDKGDYTTALEVVSRDLKILKDKQKHESYDDVLLTLEVARHYKKHYNVDVITKDFYEGKRFEKRGKVVVVSFIIDGKIQQKDFAFLSSNKTYSLWVNMTDFDQSKGKENITWFSRTNSSMCIMGESTKTFDLSVLEQYENLTPEDYFTDHPCDLEEHVYKAGISTIKSLSEFVQCKNMFLYESLSDNEKKFFTTLYERYYMINNDNKKADKILKKYCIYRYGGEMTIKNKSKRDTTPERYIKHSTLSEIIEKTTSALNDQSLSKSEKKIMQNLLEFIKQSDVIRVCPELLNYDKEKTPTETL